MVKKAVKKKVPALPDVEFVRPYWAHKEYVFNKAFVVNRVVELTNAIAAEGKLSQEEIFFGLIRSLGIQNEYNKAMNSHEILR